MAAGSATVNVEPRRHFLVNIGKSYQKEQHDVERHRHQIPINCNLCCITDWFTRWHNMSGDIWIEIIQYGPVKLWDSIRIRIGRFRFDSEVKDWFKSFESAAPAVLPQTMLTVQQKTSTLAPLWLRFILCLWFCLCS